MSRDVTLIASGSYATNQVSADILNFDGRGVQVVLDATVNAGNAGSVTLTIQGKDTTSGKYYTILTGAAVATAPVTNRYTVFDGATAATNVTVNDIIPHTFRISITANNANPVTYSVGASIT